MAVLSKEALMACQLVLVPNTSEYEAPTGSHVAIVTKDYIGQVLMAKAEYAGAQLVPTGQAHSRIQLTVAQGPKALKIVCVFSASTHGRGELREDGDGDSQFLRELPGDEPFQVVRITGK
jgi:hypothetical protein